MYYSYSRNTNRGSRNPSGAEKHAFYVGSSSGASDKGIIANRRITVIANQRSTVYSRRCRTQGAASGRKHLRILLQQERNL